MANILRVTAKMQEMKEKAFRSFKWANDAIADCIKNPSEYNFQQYYAHTKSAVYYRKSYKQYAAMELGLSPREVVDIR